MCAIFGLIDYDNRFSARQRDKILNVLAKECEERGTDATGFAYNKAEHLSIYKRPLAAHKVKLKLPKEANVVLGHTRMATQGNKEKNYNNHPFRGDVGECDFALAHNGIIYNDRFLRYEQKLPDTEIGTDSYIAVQLLESGKELSPEAVAAMSEQIEGNFVFTILDRQNNSYFVKGDNPLALYHFEKLGFYIYASTDKILTSALYKLGLLKFEYTEIETTCGDILKIDSHGVMSSYKFNTAVIDSWDYRCLVSRHQAFWDGYQPRHSELSAIRQLKEFADCVGVDGETIDMLLEYGYTTDDIEDMFYMPGGIEMAVMEITGEYDCCYGEV